MSAVKIVRLYVVVKLPYIKANFSFNGISFHTKKYIYIKAKTMNQITSDRLMHCHRFSSARYLPTWWKSNYSTHGPHLHSNFLGTTPTCKTMGPSYAIQVYGATYGQLFLLSRDFFLFVQKFKKN